MAKTPSNTANLDPAMRIVVLYGKERFLIEEYTRQFADMLEKKFGGLEQFHFDGDTVEPAAVLDELRSYGLMQKHKLVILNNADAFLTGGKFASAASAKGEVDSNDDEDTLDESPEQEKNSRRPVMERYAEKPVQDATLLMRASMWRPGKIDKLIAKVGSLNSLEPLEDSKSASWCIKRIEKRYEARMNPDAAELLVARLGPELQHLDTELQKLAAMAGSGGAITRQLVSQSVGMSREEKIWDIQSVVVTGSAAAMLQKLRDHLSISSGQANSTVIPMSWAITDLMRKLYAAAQLLRQGQPPGAVIKQLKLWGSTTEPILAIAGRTSPVKLAQLLQVAIETDAHNKSGLGDPVRNLEALMVRIADTLEG